VATRDTPKAERQKVEKPPKGQVVEVAPGNGKEDPNAEYLAESSNASKKETRAKEQTAFYRNAMPQRISPQPAKETGADPVDRATEAGNKGSGGVD
jgi:hypothetical protein